MNGAVGKVTLPQGESANYLPINNNNSNTSLRQPECASMRRPRDRATRQGRNGITSVGSGVSWEGASAINRSIPGPRTVSS